MSSRAEHLVPTHSALVAAVTFQVLDLVRLRKPRRRGLDYEARYLSLCGRGTESQIFRGVKDVPQRFLGMPNRAFGAKVKPGQCQHKLSDELSGLAKGDFKKPLGNAIG
ncbi:hypothetical protein RRG08_043765 [Elysia crispata]|uniref:Uncharacterized protein n=1 Tax=Elysia crispata TaxID=231223 RepID=A0AAE1ED89_9GAST|nr:hypothetical protein RRG08_043765 [Elysia crispata]